MVRPLFFCFLVILSACAAPTPGESSDFKTLVLRGRTTDRDGWPLERVRVSIEGQSLRLATLSDDQGRYTLEIPLGTVDGIRREPLRLTARAERKGWSLGLPEGHSQLGLEMSVVPGSDGILRCVARSNDPRFAAAAARTMGVGTEAKGSVQIHFVGVIAETPSSPAAPVLSQTAQTAVSGIAPDPTTTSMAATRPISDAPSDRVWIPLGDTIATEPRAARAFPSPAWEPSDPRTAPPVEREASRSRPGPQKSKAQPARPEPAAPRRPTVTASRPRSGAPDAGAKSSVPAASTRSLDPREQARLELKAREEVLARIKAEMVKGETKVEDARDRAPRTEQVASPRPAAPARSTAARARAASAGSPRRTSRPVTSTRVPPPPPDRSVSVSASAAPVADSTSHAALLASRIPTLPEPPSIPTHDATSPVFPNPENRARARSSPLVIRADSPPSQSAETGCACRIRGTVEVRSERPLKERLRIRVALAQNPRVTDTVELFMGSPRAFELGPVPCGTYSLELAVPATRPPLQIVSRDEMQPFSCDGLRQVRLVLAPR
jgi:hypothetical protein